MDEKEMKNLLSGRLYIELQLFKYSVLCQTKEEIYSNSYKIEVFVTIYEILLEDIEKLDEETAYKLLCWNGGILEFLYQEWLTKEDSTFEELKAYIGAELGNFLQKNSMDCGKESADGTGIDTAA